MSRSRASVVMQGHLSNESVLRAEVSWGSLQTAGVISKEQLGVVCSLDKQKAEAQVALFHANSETCVRMFNALLAGANKDDVVRYVLAMLDELISADASICKDFHEQTTEESNPFAPLLKLVTASSSFTQDKASSVLGRLFAYQLPAASAVPAAASEAIARYLVTFTEWLLSVIKGVPASGGESLETVGGIAALQLLLSAAPGRAAFLAADGLPVICALVNSKRISTQLLYHMVFCVWSLSYSSEAAAELASPKSGCVTQLVEIIKTVPKEKVVRVALAALRNLLGVGTASADMVGAGIMKVLSTLQVRKWSDEDILEDVEHLVSVLQTNLHSISSYEVYANEVLSGRLEWSPSHKSEEFWRENFKAFEGSDNAVLKQLVALLSSEDPQVLAIACNDIAEFVKVHPQGRKLMTQLGAKGPAMQVLKHPDTQAQKYALNCVQRLMVINWEYLAKA